MIFFFRQKKKSANEQVRHIEKKAEMHKNVVIHKLDHLLEMIKEVDEVRIIVRGQLR